MLAAAAVTLAVGVPPLAPYVLLAGCVALLGRRRKAVR